MTRPEVERARALLERADADLAAVRALETVDTVPDEIVGFHGEQAAEKLLKAVLAGHGIEFPRTHSLRFLLDLLADRGLGPPAELHVLTELYPFGVQLRYEAPLDEEPLDRTALRELLEHLRDWTGSQIPTA
jgi:HEPN domain-containing protein